MNIKAACPLFFLDDEKLGPIYEVKIEPNGKRRVIEFFIYPIIRYLDEGLSVR